MKSDYFKNQYPLEELVPDLKEGEEHVLSNNCDTYNKIDWLGLDIDPDDLNEDIKTLIDSYCEGLTAEHFKEGYEAAQAIINKKLKPLQVLSIHYETKNP